MPTLSIPLPRALENQDAEFDAAFAILQSAIREKAFPAASVAITFRGQLVASMTFGHFTYDTTSREPNPTTLFDLASVTKVVATTAMAMLLHQRGFLDLETPAVSIVPEFAGSDSRRSQITLRMLLAHSSGLPAYEKLYLRCTTKGELLAAVFREPLSAEPDTRPVYSDLGFILLGVALERIAGESIDRFCAREIFGPYAMVHTAFEPPPSLHPDIPPTVDDKAFRHRVIQGEVNDENAYVLGGVAGHAGLFATAEDVATFAHAMLSGGGPVLRPETIALFTKRQLSPTGTFRALGWDTPSPPSQSGKYFSDESFGHLGYTGTSLWIDRIRQISVTLLTNRTWPDAKNGQIKRVRPEFHDAVIKCLLKEIS